MIFHILKYIFRILSKFKIKSIRGLLVPPYNAKFNAKFKATFNEKFKAKFKGHWSGRFFFFKKKISKKS